MERSRAKSCPRGIAVGEVGALEDVVDGEGQDEDGGGDRAFLGIVAGQVTCIGPTF